MCSNISKSMCFHGSTKDWSGVNKTHFFLNFIYMQQEKYVRMTMKKVSYMRETNYFIIMKWCVVLV